MTQSELILRTIVDNHRAQEKDVTTNYWKPDGGTYSNEIAKLCGLPADVVELEAEKLAKLGFVELIVRDKSVPYRGLRALRDGKTQSDRLQAEEQAIADAAAAAAELQAAEDEKNAAAVDVITRATNLGLLTAAAVDSAALSAVSKTIN